MSRILRSCPARTRSWPARLAPDSYRIEPAVFSSSGGKLTRVEFHLDRERAMKAAGLAE
jgi:hypothetical protein